MKTIELRVEPGESYQIVINKGVKRERVKRGPVTDKNEAGEYTLTAVNGMPKNRIPGRVFVDILNLKDVVFTADASRRLGGPGVVRARIATAISNSNVARKMGKDLYVPRNRVLPKLEDFEVFQDKEGRVTVCSKF